jgi:hypothetical protein
MPAAEFMLSFRTLFSPPLCIVPVLIRVAGLINLIRKVSSGATKQTWQDPWFTIVCHNTGKR